LRRIGEPAQFDPDLLAALHEAGIIPGASITYTQVANGMVWLTSEKTGQGMTVTEDFASHLYVASR
jgi:DtxR family Mn-dependent transcriptional regulator